MTQFKVGDWVRDNQDGEIFRHKKDCRVRKEVIDKYWEPWQPKAGEWCWFWDDGEHPQIDTFWWRKDNSKGLNPKQFVGYITYKAYEHCEPFIGALPSCVND